MKKLITITFLLISSLAFSQRDTLIQNSTGYKFQFYNKFLQMDMLNDTISEAYLVYNSNRLLWASNSVVNKTTYTSISDSIINLFDTNFQEILNSLNLLSFEDSSGIYSLSRVTIHYKNISLSEIFINYTKNEKSPNGLLLNNSSLIKKKLTNEQLIPFTQLLLNAEVRFLYLGLYARSLGNE